MEHPNVNLQPQLDAARQLEVIAAALPSILDATSNSDLRAAPLQETAKELVHRWISGTHGILATGKGLSRAAYEAAWPHLVTIFPVPDQVRPREAFDETHVLGAQADIMALHGKSLERWRHQGFEAGQITYLAGMRPFGTTRDMDMFAVLGIEPRPLASESEAAELIVEKVHRGRRLAGSLIEASGIVEVPNELGRRTVSHSYFATEQDKGWITVHNAAAVARGKGVPRHTTESVITEVLQTSPPKLGANILMLATYPHGVRVGSEAQRVLHEQGRPDINFAVYERIPPANRLAMANVLLGEIPATIKHLLEAAQLPAAQEHQLERVKVVDTLAQLPALIDRHAALADRALLALGPPQEDASPALSKDQLYTPRRGDVKVPDLSEYQRQVLKETGIEAGVAGHYDMTPEKLGLAPGYALYVDPGTGIKVFHELALAAKDAGVIFVGATEDRTVPLSDGDARSERARTAALLGIHPSELADTEYAVARQVAEKLVVATPDRRVLPFTYDIDSQRLQTDGTGKGAFELIGRSETGAPVVMVRLDRVPGEHPKEYSALGATGAIKVIDEVLEQPGFADVLGTSKDAPLCFATSAHYLLTRPVAVADSQEQLARRGSKRPVKLAYYRRPDGSQKIELPMILSEVGLTPRAVQAYYQRRNHPTNKAA